MITLPPLTHYQEEGVAALLAGLELHRAHGLFDEPRLGKTRQFAEVVRRKTSLLRVLCVVPAGTKLNFADEIALWTPDTKVFVVRGTPSERRAVYDSYFSTPAVSVPLMLVVNYELFLRDAEILHSITWDCVMCDEAHRLGNHRAKSGKLIRKTRSMFRIAMTGTPVANRPDSVYGLFAFLQPALLGDWFRFDRRYVVRDYFGGIKSFVNLDELALRIKPYYTRRTQAEVFADLPARYEHQIRFELSDTERKLYSKIRKQLVLELTERETSKISLASLGNALTRMVRLQQVADGAQLVGDALEPDEGAKIGALCEVLTSQIPPEERTVVFTRFSSMAELIVKRLEREGIDAAVITGNVPMDERHRIVTTGAWRVLVGTEAISEGLDIAVAQNIVHYELPWSIRVFKQREGRIEGMRQKHEKNYYYLTAVGTVDERVAEVLLDKKRMADGLLGDVQIREEIVAELL